MWLKAGLAVTAVVVPGLVVLGCWLLCSPRRVAQSAAVRASELACALGPGELDQRQQKLAAFRARAREVRELDAGFALQFDLDDRTFQEAASIVSDESHCCSFLDFRLTVQPSRKLLAVEITGPQGTKEFLAANIVPGASRSEVRTKATQPNGQAECDCPGVLGCSLESCRPPEGIGAAKP